MYSTGVTIGPKLPFAPPPKSVDTDVVLAFISSLMILRVTCVGFPWIFVSTGYLNDVLMQSILVVMIALLGILYTFDSS